MMQRRSFILTGLLALFGQDARAKREKSHAKKTHHQAHRGRQKDRPLHPPHPPHPKDPTTTTTPPPPGSTTTTTTSTPSRYIVRFYDHTDLYSSYVVDIANYYATLLAPYGVDVRYIRQDVIPGDVCWNMSNEAEPGIRVCEEIKDTITTAASTGMFWTQTGPNAWALGSRVILNYSRPDTIFTCCDTCPASYSTTAGVYLPCHEFGHSFGLQHRPNEQLPRSCMSINGCWSPSYLADDEVATIVRLLPTGGTTRAQRLGSRQRHDVCEIPPPN